MTNKQDTVTEAETRAAKNGARVDMRTILADLQDRFGRPLTPEESQAAFKGWTSREEDRRALYRQRQEQAAAEARQRR